MQKEIKFSDGYTVSIDGGSVVVAMSGLKNYSHVLDFQGLAPVSPESAIGRRITKTGKSLADYIAGKNGYAIRAGNGVREALAEAIAEELAAQAQRKEEWDRAAAAERAADQKLRDAMLAEEAKLVSEIPAGCVRLDATIRSDGDGGTYVTTWFHGVAVDDDGRKWATAVRPGAGGAFDRRVVAWASQARVEAALVEAKAKAEAKAAANAKKAAEKAAKFAEAKSTGKKVKLVSWMTDRCMRRSRDCSFDLGTEWAMPDGSTTVTYACCH